MVRLAIASLFAALFAASTWLAFHPRASFYAYNLPIALPFALFVQDRIAAHLVFRGRARALLDLVVVALALSRVVYATPFVSGHVLFLAYATVTAETRLARVLSAIVLAHVMFTKLVLWHDYATPAGALLVTAAATIAWRRLSPSDDSGSTTG